MANKRSTQKIVLVTGKGGVGKSSVAAAIAAERARRGLRVLLVELSELSFYKYVFDRPIEYTAQEVRPNLWVSRWDGQSCLKEYLLHYIKIERIVNLFFENKIMKTLVQVAPALKELAVLGKITSGIRKIGPALDYDLIVIDSYATGHFKAFLQAPVGMGEVISFGPMGEQSRSIQRVITDPALCKTVIVSLPEELPVTESLELKDFLEQGFQQKPTIILNKRMPTPLTLDELEALRQQLQGPSEASLPLKGAYEFTSYLQAVEGRQRGYQERLESDGERVLTLPLELTAASNNIVEILSHKVEGFWND